MKPDDEVKHDEKPEHDVLAEKEIAARSQARRLDLGHDAPQPENAQTTGAGQGVGLLDRVLYYPDNTETIRAMPGRPLAALVCYAHSQEMVNLAVFDINGAHHTRTSVMLIRSGEPKPPFSHAVL
jgi:hypothetical protein